MHSVSTEERTSRARPGTLAYLLWAAPVHGQPVSLYLPLAPVVVLFPLGYGQAGLYPGLGLGPVEVLRRYAQVTIAAFVIMAPLVFGLKVEHLYSRATLGLGFVFSLVLVALFRGGVTRVASRWSWWPSRGRWWAAGPSPEETEKRDDPWGPVVERAAASAERGVRLAFADVHGPDSEAVVDRLCLVFPRVIMLRSFVEFPVEGAQVRNQGGVLGREYGTNLLLRQSRWVKRAVDLVVTLPAAILSLPVMLIGMLAVRVASPGPALFFQVREGRLDRSIWVPKIRTMVPDAEAHMEEILEADPELRREWEADVEVQKSYDLYYIRNWSIWLDLYILSRTVSAVVMGRGGRGKGMELTRTPAELRHLIRTPPR